MSRTVTALYDNRSDAEAAKQRMSSTVDTECVKIVDQSTSHSGGSDDNQKEQGSWLSRLFIADEDRHAYSEGVRRGGYLLCAEVDNDEDADRIVSVLEQTSGTVNLDERQENWRSEGWQPYSGSSGSSGFGTDSSQARMSSGSDDRTVEEERIPIVEETLNVGKRRVERGGATVRSYVRETPVHEQVSLRDEHVSVERRPVNEPIARGELDSDMLRERTIEMRETDEEAVVEKVARVTEEVVVKKTASEHSEQIDDTVRRTEVDVDENVDRDGDRSAFGGFGSDRGQSGQTEAERAEFERSRRDR